MDNPEATVAGASSDTTSKDMVQIDGAVLEKLQQESQEYKTLLDEARSLNFETVGDYLDHLSDEKHNAEPVVTSASPTTTNSNPIETAPAPAPASKEEDRYDQKFKDLEKKFDDDSKRRDRMGAQAYISSQEAVFRQDQRDLPEEQRSGHTMRAMMEMITGPKSGLVKELVNNDPDLKNIFAASCFVLNSQKGSKVAVPTETEKKAKEALDKAKETVSLGQGSQPPTTKTDDRDENSTLADDICPDDRPVEPT